MFRKEANADPDFCRVLSVPRGAVQRGGEGVMRLNEGTDGWMNGIRERNEDEKRNDQLGGVTLNGNRVPTPPPG